MKSRHPPDNTGSRGVPTPFRASLPSVPSVCRHRPRGNAYPRWTRGTFASFSSWHADEPTPDPHNPQKLMSSKVYERVTFRSIKINAAPPTGHVRYSATSTITTLDRVWRREILAQKKHRS